MRKAKTRNLALVQQACRAAGRTTAPCCRRHASLQTSLRRFLAAGRTNSDSSHCTCYGSPFPVRDGNEMDTSLSDPCHSPLINFSEPSHKSLRTIQEPSRSPLKNLPIIFRSLFKSYHNLSEPCQNPLPALSKPS